MPIDENDPLIQRLVTAQENTNKLMSEMVRNSSLMAKAGSRKFDIEYDNIIDFTKEITRQTKELKKAQPLLSKFTEYIGGVSGPLDDLNETIKNIDKQLEEHMKKEVNADQIKQQDALNEQKRELIKAAAANNAKVALGSFAVGTADVIASLYNGSQNFVKGLQDNMSGVELATQTAKDAVDATQKTTSVLVGGFGDAVGTAAMAFGPWGIAFAAVLKIITTAIDFFSKKTAEVSKQGLDTLGKELTKTQKSYTDITAAGVILAGGMTELRNSAYQAGMGVDQFASAIKNSREDLLMMGGGIGEGTKQLAKVSGQIRNSDIGIQLRKLGYSTEEQAELSAAVMANLNAAGDKRATNEKYVAQQTAQYGKDLRILADITGQDARKAMEKAREQAMEQDLLAQAMAEGGADAVEKLQQQLATMPESMKKGYMEFVSTGGTAIADAATNVAIAQNPKIMAQYKRQINDLRDHNVNAHQAMINSGKYTEDTAQYQLENIKNMKDMATATRLVGGSEGMTGAVKIGNELVVKSRTLHKGATDAANKAADEAAKNMAPLDKATAQLEENTQHLKAALGKELTNSITNFAETSAKGVDTIGAALMKLGLTPAKVVGKAAGAISGPTTRGMVRSSTIPVATGVKGRGGVSMSAPTEIATGVKGRGGVSMTTPVNAAPPTPAATAPTPAATAPTPTPAATAPTPTPAATAPTPVTTAPIPVATAPTPVTTAPIPVATAPTPTPVTSAQTSAATTPIPAATAPINADINLNSTATTPIPAATTPIPAATPPTPAATPPTPAATPPTPAATTPTAATTAPIPSAKSSKPSAADSGHATSKTPNYTKPPPIVPGANKTKPRPTSPGAMNTNMSEDDTKELIKKHEGGVLTRPYQDTKKLWTIGVGHLIGDGKTLPSEWDKTFSVDSLLKLFDEDYNKLKTAAAKNIPNFDKMTGMGKAVFTDITFNMGGNWINGKEPWPILQRQLKDMDSNAAAANLAGSKWAGQVGNRAKEDVPMVENAFPKMKDGGIVAPSNNGTNVKVAEAGKHELISPLDKGMLPGMQDLINSVNKLVSISKDYKDVSEKQLKGMSPGMQDLIDAVNKLVSISKDHKDVSEKQLWATS